jgi:chemotaxis protein CheX
MTITTSEIGEELINGTRDVFSTMLMTELETVETICNKRVDIDSNLTSMLGLGGGLRGVLAVHCPAMTAQKITGVFLDMEVDEINDDVKDAIGEIANMVAGNLKVACMKNDINIEIAIPTSIVGSSFAVSGIAEANRVIVKFAMNEDFFWVELMYVLAS